MARFSLAGEEQVGGAVRREELLGWVSRLSLFGDAYSAWLKATGFATARPKMAEAMICWKLCIFAVGLRAVVDLGELLCCDRLVTD